MPQRKIKVGTWIDARRVRIVKNGRKHEIQIDTEPKPRKKRRNISQGYIKGGVFHPIRAASDYSRTRAGESKHWVATKRKKPAYLLKKKKATTKKKATAKRRR